MGDGFGRAEGGLDVVHGGVEVDNVGVGGGRGRLARAEMANSRMEDAIRADD